MNNTETHYEQAEKLNIPIVLPAENDYSGAEICEISKEGNGEYIVSYNDEVNRVVAIYSVTTKDSPNFEKKQADCSGQVWKFIEEMHSKAFFS